MKQRAVEAEVLEELPQAKYRVVLKNGQKVIAHPAGVTRNFVRLLPGDRIEVELMPQDTTRGRIMRKL